MLVAGEVAGGKLQLASEASIDQLVTGRIAVTVRGGLLVTRLVAVDLASVPARGKLLGTGATAVGHCDGFWNECREVGRGEVIEDADHKARCVTRGERDESGIGSQGL